MSTAQHGYRILATECAWGKFSFFKYARHIASGSPPGPLRRIFSLMRSLHCSFLVEEEFEPSHLPEDMQFSQVEVGLLKRLYAHALDRRIYRLTFFKTDQHIEFSHGISDPIDSTREERNRETLLRLSRERALYCLGFLWLFCDYDQKSQRPLSSYVPRAVVDVDAVERTFAGLYIHSVAPYEIHALNETFAPVKGSLFTQQEGKTWCCAHAALTMAIENLFRVQGKKCPISYFEMNDFLSIDHVSRYAFKGLSPDEIRSVFGHRKIQWEADLYDSAVDATYDSANEVLTAAYHAVEAGLPAILCFEGEGVAHAMAVVGHSFDPNLWSARATGAYFSSELDTYTPSHSWVESLVVQDDNLGPYCTLPRQLLLKRKPSIIVPRFPWSESADIREVELLAGKLLTGQVLEEGRRSYFETIIGSEYEPHGESGYWFAELVNRVANRDFVLRTVPYSPREYLQFIASAEHGAMLKGAEEAESGLRHNLGDMPFWLVEVSLPELFQTNTTRLGEVVIHERKSRELRFGLVRIPGVLTIFFENARYQHHRIGGAYHYDIASRTPQTFSSLIDRNIASA